MADEAIVSRAMIRERARAAFRAGRSRDSHGMNFSALALPDWLAEYDRCAYEANHSGPAAISLDSAQVLA